MKAACDEFVARANYFKAGDSRKPLQSLDNGERVEQGSWKSFWKKVSETPLPVSSSRENPTSDKFVKTFRQIRCSRTAWVHTAYGQKALQEIDFPFDDENEDRKTPSELAMDTFFTKVQTAKEEEDREATTTSSWSQFWNKFRVKTRFKSSDNAAKTLSHAIHKIRTTHVAWVHTEVGAQRLDEIDFPQNWVYVQRVFTRPGEQYAHRNGQMMKAIDTFVSLAKRYKGGDGTDPVALEDSTTFLGGPWDSFWQFVANSEVLIKTTKDKDARSFLRKFSTIRHRRALWANTDVGKAALKGISFPDTLLADVEEDDMELTSSMRKSRPSRRG